LSAVLALMLWIAAAAAPQQQTAPVRVLVETDAGQIELEIDVTRAPVTSANFLKYVDAGLYDGGRFHRTVKPDNQPNNAVKIQVIQGAANAERKPEHFAPIPLERTSLTGLSHLDGTLSMARTGPDTARDEFFICIGDQKSLDFGGARNPDGQGFAAFGRVVRGMDIVRKIQSSTAVQQTLQPPVRILRIRRI
jgi:peptidyl-prolyl cis-trans isomerase A (cyclophilin A)